MWGDTADQEIDIIEGKREDFIERAQVKYWLARKQAYVSCSPDAYRPRNPLRSGSRL